MAIKLPNLGTPAWATGIWNWLGRVTLRDVLRTALFIAPFAGLIFYTWSTVEAYAGQAVDRAINKSPTILEIRKELKNTRDQNKAILNSQRAIIKHFNIKVLPRVQPLPNERPPR